MRIADRARVRTRLLLAAAMDAQGDVCFAVDVAGEPKRGGRPRSEGIDRIVLEPSRPSPCEFP